MQALSLEHKLKRKESKMADLKKLAEEKISVALANCEKIHGIQQQCGNVMFQMDILHMSSKLKWDCRFDETK